MLTTESEVFKAKRDGSSVGDAIREMASPLAAADDLWAGDEVVCGRTRPYGVWCEGSATADFPPRPLPAVKHMALGREGYLGGCLVTEENALQCWDRGSGARMVATIGHEAGNAVAVG